MNQKAKRGSIIIICAPSGTGKSTLLDRLKKDVPDLKWSVSCTTRPMRPGEVEGEHYHFIAVEDFKKRIDLGDFIEWAQVHSNFYGTSKSFVDKGLLRGEGLLFDLDVQGADAMKKHYGAEAHVIFIAPPSIEELEKRLKGRGTDADAVIAERLKNAVHELKRSKDYDSLVINQDIERAYSELKSIVTRILKGS